MGELYTQKEEDKRQKRENLEEAEEKLEEISSLFKNLKMFKFTSKLNVRPFL